MQNNHMSQNSNRQVKALALTFLLCCFSQAALAAGNPIEGMLGGIISFFNSGVVRSVAIIAIIGMGIAAYLGRVSWELAMKIGAGIILTVGAPALADQFMSYAA